jgi:hypothetical protein
VSARREREEDLVERRLLPDDALPDLGPQTLERGAQRSRVGARALRTGWRGSGGGAQRTGRR